MYHYHPHVILYIIYLQLESYPIEKSHIWKRGGNIWSVILRRIVSSIIEVAPWRSIKRMSLLERGIKAYGVILVFSPYGLTCVRYYVPINQMPIEQSLCLGYILTLYLTKNLNAQKGQIYSIQSIYLLLLIWSINILD